MSPPEVCTFIGAIFAFLTVCAIVALLVSIQSFLAAILKHLREMTPPNTDPPQPPQKMATSPRRH